MSAKKASPARRSARKSARKAGTRSAAIASPNVLLGTGGVPNLKVFADYASASTPTFWFELHMGIEFSTRAELDALREAFDADDEATARSAIMNGKIRSGVDKSTLKSLLIAAFKLRQR